MSTEQNNTTDNKFSMPNWGAILGWTSLMSKTLVVLVFIVNSVAIGLYAMGLVNPDRQTSSIFGAIAFAFAVVVLAVFVNGGVKQQAIVKRKR